MNKKQKDLDGVLATITEAANRLIDVYGYSKIELAKELGITRPSLDSRLSKNTWKKLEIFWINKLYLKESKARTVWRSK